MGTFWKDTTLNHCHMYIKLEVVLVQDCVDQDDLFFRRMTMNCLLMVFNLSEAVVLFILLQ